MRRLMVFVAAMVVLGAVAATATGALLGAIFGSSATSPGGWLLIGALFIVATLGLARGIRGFRGYARPVRALVEATHQIEAGDYSVRVPERGPREVAGVARAFNQMTAQLEAADQRRRSVVADVAHELRTPLAVIRGQAEGIADGVYTDGASDVVPILEAVRLMEALIEDLGTLVLADSGHLRLEYEPVDIEVLVNETAAALGGTARAAGVEVRVEATGSLPAVDADPGRLRSVVTNLLANALRHTSAGGSVTVGLSAAPGAVTLAVEDTGEGIPPDLLPRVFERFVKGPGSPGSGLGLAIARDIVEAHGGTITATNGAGGGAVVSVTLPEVRG